MLFSGLFRSYLMTMATSMVNSVCHSDGRWGYRRYELNDGTTNELVTTILTFGEGLHNNHHGYPRSPKFSFRASEFDPAWPLIKLLIVLKLAKPYKTIHEVAAA